MLLLSVFLRGLSMCQWLGAYSLFNFLWQLFSPLIVLLRSDNCLVWLGVESLHGTGNFVATSNYSLKKRETIQVAATNRLGWTPCHWKYLEEGVLWTPSWLWGWILCPSFQLLWRHQYSVGVLLEGCFRPHSSVDQFVSAVDYLCGNSFVLPACCELSSMRGTSDVYPVERFFFKCFQQWLHGQCWPNFTVSAG